MKVRTTTNITPTWAIDDEVIRLRQWGKDRVFPLYPDVREPYTLGSGTDCTIRIVDPQRRISHEHAHLERVMGRWTIVDHVSKNGLTCDGVRLDKFTLSPGMEIGIGEDVVLVAESTRWITLRSRLARMLGWSAESAASVELAARAVRLAAMRRMTLVLCGGPDLVQLAEELHRLTLGAARPFVLCKKARRDAGDESSTKWVPSGRAAVEAAAGGTVCVLHQQLPKDLEAMLAALRSAQCSTQLVVCAARVRDVGAFASAPVVVPPLSTRPRLEIERIILEYATEAAAVMDLGGHGGHWLSPGERVWIHDHCGDSLPEIQQATLRLAAIRSAGSVSAGALRVGISHTAMIKWLRTRHYPDIAILRAAHGVPGSMLE